MRLLELVERYFGVILLGSVVLGLTIPEFVAWIAEYDQYILMFILLLVFIKIDMGEVIHHIRNPALLAYVLGINLVLAPILIYGLSSSMPLDYRIALLLLAALPTGVSATAFTDLLKGESSLTLVITVLSSILAPITITGLFYFMMGSGININFVQLLYSLLIIILIPLVLAQIVRYCTGTAIKNTYQYLKSLTILLVALIVMAVIAKEAETIRQALGNTLIYLVVLYIMFFVLYIISYLSVLKYPKKTKIAVSNSNVFMNIGLGIVIASSFFSANVVLMMVLAQIPWNTMPGIIQLMKKYLP